MKHGLPWLKAQARDSGALVVASFSGSPSFCGMASEAVSSSVLRGVMAYLIPSAVTLDLYAPTPRRMPHFWEAGAGAYLDADDYAQDDIDMLVEPLREQALRQFVEWADAHPTTRTVVRRHDDDGPQRITSTRGFHAASPAYDYQASSGIPSLVRGGAFDCGGTPSHTRMAGLQGLWTPVLGHKCTSLSAPCFSIFY